MKNLEFACRIHTFDITNCIRLSCPSFSLALFVFTLRPSLFILLLLSVFTSTFPPPFPSLSFHRFLYRRQSFVLDRLELSTNVVPSPRLQRRSQHRRGCWWEMISRFHELTSILERSAIALCCVVPGWGPWKTRNSRATQAQAFASFYPPHPRARTRPWDSIKNKKLLILPSSKRLFPSITFFMAITEFPDKNIRNYY